MNKPEWMLFEDDETYHNRSKSGEVISSHMLSSFRWSPAKYKLKVDGLLPQPPSEALEFGRAAHCLILEGEDKFHSIYTVDDGPINPKTGEVYGKQTKAFAQWRQEQVGEVITVKDFGTILGMATAIKQHPVAGKLLADIVPEGVVRTEYHGALCQIKMDGYSEKFGIIDLKTTNDIGGFFYDISRPGYDYHYQAGFYRAVLQSASKIKAHFWFVAVEKTFPFTVGVWHVNPDVLNQAEELNQRKISELISCRESDNWPSGYEDVREYDKMLF